MAATQGPAAQLIAAAAKEGRVSLLEPEAYAVCEQYGIPVPPFKMVDSLDGALAAAKEIGYPVVIKVVSAQILHKSDIGGVMLGIGSDARWKNPMRSSSTTSARRRPESASRACWCRK